MQKLKNILLMAIMGFCVMFFCGFIMVINWEAVIAFLLFFGSAAIVAGCILGIAYLISKVE